MLPFVVAENCIVRFFDWGLEKSLEKVFFYSLVSVLQVFIFTWLVSSLFSAFYRMLHEDIKFFIGGL
jgi:hypothetical protein